MRHRITDSRIILTGASSGIGEALVFQLAQEGADILITARRGERLDDIIQKIQRQFPDYATGKRKIISFAGDITSEDVRKKIVATAVNEFGGIDILINNSGAGAIALFETTTIETARNLMELNYFAVFELTKHALPYLKEAVKSTERTTRGIRPIIVNLSSIVGLRGVPYYSAYGAAKFAINGFSESLRAELYKDGIDVLVVCPGTTKTEFFDVLHQSDSAPDFPAHHAVTPEYVACRIVKAIKSGEARIIPYFLAVVLDGINRMSPQFTNWIMRRYVSPQKNNDCENNNTSGG
ncbi:MAG: SDR family NAD(P)-dependent oxidoreductase [Planctomycetaceae bacterium]|nr:SDR family NAD(P)-dependent oxidoreductase [Planctomycetaceae bacterium]